MINTPTTRIVLALVAAAGLAQSALAQQTPPPSQPPAKAPEAQPETKPSQPSLDDLLGIPKDKKPAKPDAKPRPEATDPTKTELECKLSARGRRAVQGSGGPDG